MIFYQARGQGGGGLALALEGVEAQGTSKCIAIITPAMALSTVNPNAM